MQVFFVSITILVAGLSGTQAFAESDRIAGVQISGNVITRDRDIYNILDLYAGMDLPDEATLLRLEIRLLMRFHDRFDLATGKRPTITVLPRNKGSRFRDIEIHFPEKPAKKP